MTQPSASAKGGERCGTCRFFTVVQCRRYPPSIPPSRDYSGYSSFPKIQAEYWCGEFQPKDLYQ